MKYADRNTEPAADTRHCANVEYGNRCANIGVFSWSTTGSEKWFCRRHFFPHDPPHVFPRYDSIAIMPDERKRNDGKNWARKILYRKDQGEALPHLSLELANAALDVHR